MRITSRGPAAVRGDSLPAAAAAAVPGRWPGGPFPGPAPGGAAEGRVARKRRA